MIYFFANIMNTIMVSKFYATKNAEELKTVTKSDQIWRIQKTRLCKVFENQQFTKSCCAPGGNRTRTAFSGQGIFVPLWLSPPITACGLDYSFTVGLCPLGVPCLVSAPSSIWRLGSRLPSALPAKVSLNLRHSTSLFSDSALKCV